MHKLTVLYPHPTAPDEFRRYYTDIHLPLARQLPGLLGSRHAFDVQAVGDASPYFCVFEADFENAKAMGAAMASDIGKKVAADVPNYATGGAIVLHYEVLAA